MSNESAELSLLWLTQTDEGGRFVVYVIGKMMDKMTPTQIKFGAVQIKTLFLPPIDPQRKHPELWQLQRLHNPGQAGIALLIWTGWLD